MNFQRVRSSLQGDAGSVRVVLCNVSREVLENDPLIASVVKLYDSQLTTRDEEQKESQS